MTRAARLRRCRPATGRESTPPQQRVDEPFRVKMPSRGRRRRRGSAAPRSSDRVSASTARSPRRAAARRPRFRSGAGARAPPGGLRALRRAASSHVRGLARTQLGARALTELDVPGRVPVPERGRIGELVEPLGRELANRLEHPVAVAGAAKQALVDERGDRVDVGAADLLGGLERAAAGEHGQPGEQVLLGRRRAGRGSRRSSPAASADAPALTGSRRRAEAVAARAVRAAPAARAPSPARPRARSQAAGSRAGGRSRRPRRSRRSPSGRRLPAARRARLLPGRAAGRRRSPIRRRRAAARGS